MFFQPQYLQDILDYSPTEAGLLILPVTLPMVVLSPFAGRLIAAFGPRATMTVGMAFAVAGLAVQAVVGAGDGYGPLLVGYLLFGIALGLVYAPMSVAAMAAMPESKAGIASGVLAMNRVLAGALALAACGAVFHTTLTSRIESEAAARPLSERDAGELEGLSSGTPSAQAALARQPATEADEIRAGVDEAYDDALGAALWIVVVLAAVGTGLTWAFVRAPEGATGAAPDPGRAEHQHHRRFHL
jgi:MFS family permease